MRRNTLIIILSLLCFTHVGFSQDEILLKIGDTEVSKTEFKRIYEKNNSPDISIDVKTVDEYLDLFINFKLKVIEAESLGMDTAQEFVDELNMYRDELAKPYLVDEEMYEAQIKEAYERRKDEVRVNYVFFELKTTASPSDTLEIFNKAIEVSKRLQKGEDFEKVTADSTLGIKSSGDTWFLTSLKAPYQIENFMYENEIGAVSNPFREKNGYYVIQITAKRKNPGEVKVSHIMISVPQGSTEEFELKAKAKIDSIKSKIDEGEDFAELAKQFSDDKASGAKGGELMKFGTGVMVQPFEEAAFSIENIGDVTDPIKTFYGWHIIKLLEKTELANYDDLYSDLKAKVKNDPRYELCEKSIIEKLKKDYNFTEEKDISNFYNVVDTSIFKAKWDISKTEKLNDILFTFENNKITEQDFAKYLFENQKWQEAKDINLFVDTKYQDFIADKILEYEKNNLENKYEDFKNIMQEYHDGILLFSLQEETVWNKAIKDSVGLAKYYEEHKNEYMAPEKIDATIFSFSDESYKNTALKIMKKKAKKNYADTVVVSMVDETKENFSISENGEFAKGDNETIDIVFTMKDKGENIKTGNYYTFEEEKTIVYINKIIPIKPKEFNEVKGLIIAEYQTILEQKWIQELKEKYEISINQEVLDSLK